MSPSIAYCTLFDLNYLDKGLAMCQSIRKFNATAPLYLLAIDERAEDILRKIGLNNVIVVSLKEIEKYYLDLHKIKANRSLAEYCWTLTPFLIDFTFRNINCDICTYLDSDLWFFANPDILNEEFLFSNSVAMIMPHRFPKTKDGRKKEKTYGKYCVEFNSFINQEKSLKVLRWWEDRVIEKCEYNKRKGEVGDQKYLEQFEHLGDKILINSNLGGGLAPWNIGQYSLVLDESEFILRDKDTQIQFRPVFYHYQNIKYIGQNVVNINVGKAERSLKRKIYFEYLQELQKIRKWLGQKYGVTFTGNRFVFRKKIPAWIQKNLMKFYLKNMSISDIMIIK